MSPIKKEASGNQPPVSLKANNRAVRQLSDRHLNTSSGRTPGPRIPGVSRCLGCLPAQQPSYSAKAEYPVRRSLSIPLLTSRNTGSPAFAGDDGWGDGALVLCDSFIFQGTDSKRTFATSPRNAPEA